MAFVDPKSKVLGNVTYPLLASGVSRLLIFKLFRLVLGVRKLKLTSIFWGKSFKRINFFYRKSLRRSIKIQQRLFKKKKAMRRKNSLNSKFGRWKRKALGRLPRGKRRG